MSSVVPATSVGGDRRVTCPSATRSRTVRACRGEPSSSMAYGRTGRTQRPSVASAVASVEHRLCLTP